MRGIFRGSSARQAEKIQEYLIVNMLFDSWCRTIRNIKKGSPQGGPFLFLYSGAQAYALLDTWQTSKADA